jgi:DNA-binding beta-propeller fold protein YncE
MRSPSGAARHAFALVALVVPLLAAATPARAEFHLLRRAELGGEGGWDFITVDGTAHRLYVTRGSHVMVVDTDSLTVVGDVPDTPGVHGVALVPDLGVGFASNGRDTSVTIFDLATLRARQRVRVGRGPDAIVYDPASRRVFTLNGGSNDATAIDAASGKVVGTVALGGRPEVPACDGRGRMYVNLEDSSAVVAVDTRSLKVVGRWPLSPGEGPTGLALDAVHGRLFSGCANRNLVVTDAHGGRVMATLPIGGRVDGVAFDPALGLAFSSNGEGSLTVVHEDSPGAFSVRAEVPTAPGARTLALDPLSHRVYLVTARFGPAPEPTAEQPRPRAPMVPGSFQVLVFGE